MQIEKAVRLRENEEVLAVLRNHGMTRLPRFLLAFVFVAAPFFFMLPLFRQGTYGVAAFCASFALGLYLAVREWFLWRRNAFIVTDMRVIDMDQRGWFSRTVSEADYDRVEDVSFAVHGILGAIFGYGSLLVQTSGGLLNLELAHVADPKNAHHVISDAMTARRGATPTAGAAAGKSGKVSQLLDAASELDAAEARAFLTTLQQAVRKTETKEEPDLRWLRDEEDAK